MRRSKVGGAYNAPEGTGWPKNEKQLPRYLHLRNIFDIVRSFEHLFHIIMQSVVLMHFTSTCINTCRSLPFLLCRLHIERSLQVTQKICEFCVLVNITGVLTLRVRRVTNVKVSEKSILCMEKSHNQVF